MSRELMITVNNASGNTKKTSAHAEFVKGGPRLLNAAKAPLYKSNFRHVSFNRIL